MIESTNLQEVNYCQKQTVQQQHHTNVRLSGKEIPSALSVKSPKSEGKQGTFQNMSDVGICANNGFDGEFSTRRAKPQSMFS